MDNEIVTKQVELVKLNYKVADNVTRETLAVTFLNLYNNVKADYRTFLQMNLYSNLGRLVLTVKKRDAYAVRDWMGFFNDVWQFINEEKVLCKVLVDTTDCLNEDILLNPTVDINSLED